jgi:hypothetical protein
MRIPAPLVAALALGWADHTHGFTINPQSHRISRGSCRQPSRILPKNTVSPQRPLTLPSPSTALNLLLDVPDGFFAITFPTLGILLSISKKFARIRMEERAWEQRLAEGRQERLRRDPSLTELDLRRQEAALEWSAYGKPRMQEEDERKQQRIAMKEQDDTAYSGNNKRKRVQVKERELDDDKTEGDARDYRMTDAEIEAFELEYGVGYDPYYDDPYGEDELPEGKFSIDKRYRDRIYESGEIFYRDADSGLFYRQGAKPRNLSYWS